jgi:hypothetical protein
VKARNHSPVAEALWGTAEARRINRSAAKSSRADEWGGWGRVSDDEPGHYNPARSEGPWGRAAVPLVRRCLTESMASTQSEEHCATAEGTNDGRKLVWNERMPGRPRRRRRPWSRTGENPPYGILGGTMETSASFGSPIRAIVLPDRRLQQVVHR